MVSVLSRMFQDSGTQLRWDTPWQLLVAVMLSAQQTDKKVNETTPLLFRKYPDPARTVAAPLSTLEKMLHRMNYYKTKARNIKKTAEIICEQFGGSVPMEVSRLIMLPGVGRKTALVVQGEVTGATEGIAVDTHVARLARKMDLTDHADPIRIEQDLCRFIPKRRWKDITGWMISYGRNVCSARPHDCTDHPLSRIFPLAAERWPRPGKRDAA